MDSVIRRLSHGKALTTLVELYDVLKSRVIRSTFFSPLTGASGLPGRAVGNVRLDSAASSRPGKNAAAWALKSHIY